MPEEDETGGAAKLPDSRKQPLLSLIVPCYNVQEFVERCLNSVLTQVDEGVEIIVINDGSSDCTFDRINACIAGYSHRSVQILQQSNKGLSGARNAGIRVAKGQYLAFLDSDDRWMPQAWETIKPLLLNDTFDLLEFDVVRRKRKPIKDGGGNVLESLGVNTLEDRAYADTDYQCLHRVFSKSLWVVWARIYRRELCSDILFHEGKRYEDTAFTPYAYLRAKAIYSSSFALVEYTDNPGSITNNMNELDIQDMLFSVARKAQHASKWKPDRPRQAALFTVAAAVQCKYLLHCKAKLGQTFLTEAEKRTFGIVRSHFRMSDLVCSRLQKIKIALALYIPRAVLCITVLRNRLKTSHVMAEN